ncbi:hypothetical protein D9619_000435 [Psilocybe cf. subviscida]|uniref:Uncharacterized protein n=1 Tax=Psilocybe cf. subviscida TaxID=2480587 RepID=A0A8H5BDZ5_9AGAR|nr:hypothetical protein D9619_000435 [Psilocybe cf. subviscida]
MATIADISEQLGDYMLKGWVLTDESCPTRGCTVPLLRSPRGRTPVTSFCVKCAAGGSQDVQAPKSQSPHPVISSAASTESHISRSSTPPTEFSEAPGSPIFIPVEESPEARRRREQSDQASAEIGRRLLKGWAMLGDECPNDTCYGVPLVRPPKKGGEKDPRKECVICGNTYITEVDWAGRENLIPSPQDDFARDDADHGGQPQATTSEHSTQLPFSCPFYRDVQQAAAHSLSVTSAPHAPAPNPTRLKSPLAAGKVSTQSLKREAHDATSALAQSEGTVLDDASRALLASLKALTDRLNMLASKTLTDPSSIGATAEAITKVTEALVSVRNAQ